MENSMEDPPIIKIELPYDVAIPPLRFLAKGIEIRILKIYLHSHIHWSTINNSEDIEQPKCPLKEERIKKIWYTHITKHSSTQKMTENPL